MAETVELAASSSLDWDGYGEDEELVTARPRIISTETLCSDDDLSFSESDDYLSPTEGLLAVMPPAQQEAAAIAGKEANLAVWRQKVNQVLMEAEEDILPFRGKRVTLSCLTALCKAAVGLKRELQAAHLELAEDPAYRDGRMTAATECRKRLSSFIVQAEADRVQLEEGEKVERNQAATAAVAQSAASAAHQPSAEAAARLPLIARRVRATREELAGIRTEIGNAVMTSPTTDEEVISRAEQLRAIGDHLAALTLDGKETSRLALEYNLLDEASLLEDELSGARKENVQAIEKLHAWRKETGVWVEKKKRSAGRTDLKLPTFTPSISGKSTIYDFEKDWVEYKQAMEYSKEEALKTLKLVIQQPTRGDVANIRKEDDIFAYLKKHHGNPMVLLNAREQEVQSWTPCKGTDLVQRDWLIQAKSKL